MTTNNASCCRPLHHPKSLRRLLASLALSSAVFGYLATTKYHAVDPRRLADAVIDLPRVSGVVVVVEKKNKNKNATAAVAKSHRRHVDADVPSFPIRHSVLTRFMVGQSRLPVLARARMELFKTFCYPTMLHQTSQGYYWLVLADPGLAPDVLDEMQRLLTAFPSQNAYLILTDNTTWASDGLSPKNKDVAGYGVSLRTIAQEFQRGSLEVRTGNTDALLDTLNDEGHGKRRSVSPLRHLLRRDDHRETTNGPFILVETLLDADDGLHRSAIEYMQNDIQRRTYQQLQQQGQDVRPDLDSTWWILCASEHMEWHNRDIFRINSTEYKKDGLSDGVVGRRAVPPECISTGFTRVGYTYDNKSLEFPKEAQYNHYQTVKIMPPCDATTFRHCYYRSLRDFPGAVRCRSITSDSMSQLDPDVSYDKKNKYTKDSKLHFDEGNDLWTTLSEQFYISREQVHDVSVHLYEHREAVLHENEAGRCIPGFPCMGHSKETFDKLRGMVGGRPTSVVAHPTSKPKEKNAKATTSTTDRKSAAKSKIAPKTRIKKHPPKAVLVQPKTVSLHETQALPLKKRHQCIEAIRRRQMDLIGDLVRSANASLPTSGPKALLVNPAYHDNVGDHMITLGEIEFLRRVGVEVPREMEQCGQPWQELLPDCEKTKWWKDGAYQASGMPALLHGGGNWGDLWRRNQDLRIRSLETFLRKNFTIVGMPQSLYYKNEKLMKKDAGRIEAALSRFQGTNIATPTFLWREEYSYEQAQQLYPFVNNILMPDIAFQLGPYQPLHLPASDPNAVDIVVFLREDHESVESKNRDSESVHSMLASLIGEEDARNTSFKIVDWNDRLGLFDSDDILFSETAIQLLSMGRVLICDRLHASILAYLSGISFIYIDQMSGKISKTLGVALDSADGCADGRGSNFARAMNLTQALEMAIDYLDNKQFR